MLDSDYQKQRLAAIDLLAALREFGVEVTGVADDSRQVRPGDLFVAYPGVKADGREYIALAVEQGAVAVIWESDGFTFPAHINVPHLAEKGLRFLVGWLAHAVAGWPTEQMPLITVTGTNGKTTVSQWIGNLYPRTCAVVGTLGAGLNGYFKDTGFTTPEATTLVRYLCDLRDQGAHAFALEASSIGIAEGRLNGGHIDTAIFTNFTRDHLDYHHTMEAYAAAKIRLFTWPRLRFAVVNLDDPLGAEIMRATNATKVVGYTLAEGRINFPAVIRAENIEDTPTGQRFLLHAPQGKVPIDTHLIGRYNLSNLLAVAAVLLDLGLPLDQVQKALGNASPPPGRMEVYGGQEGLPLVLVDYAHTPDALENALSALRPVAARRGGKLEVVFGCGGDRDAGKRPQMGTIATRLADAVWLTSDNPRSENPLAILADIQVGAPSATLVSDRGEAIARAIEQAKQEDVLLIAGKGHENYQEIAGVRHKFHDKTEVLKALMLYADRIGDAI